MDRLKISVVIPVFNSENTIQDTVKKTSRVLENYNIVETYEIILVNDGSRGASGEKYTELSRQKYAI